MSFQLPLKDKKRSASINREKDLQRPYSSLAPKKDKNLSSVSVSLQHVLNLTRTSPKQIVKNLKKTPSTSLHTPADFTKREQSLKKKIESQSPQTSYRSRLQLTKRNIWIDLIATKNSQLYLADQRYTTEYKTNIDMTATLIADWKSPYFPLVKRENPQPEELIVNKPDINKWKELMIKKMEKRKAL